LIRDKVKAVPDPHRAEFVKELKYRLTGIWNHYEL